MITVTNELVKKINSSLVESSVNALSTPCWLWLGAKDRTGYGTVYVEGKNHKVHRLVWQMKHGTIPCGMLVCHRCDVRNCANPTHLFLGSQSDNMRDMYDKNRQPCKMGESNGNSKLTSSEVQGIKSLRENGTTLRELSSIFGVCMSTISRVCIGVTWKEVS